MNPTVKTWHTRMQAKGCPFAKLTTRNAHYDRVAVVNEANGWVSIEYPKRERRGETDKWTITRETIRADRITQRRRYQD